MKTSKILLPLLLAAIALLTACSNVEESTFNSKVSACTSERISRFSPICISLSQDLDEEKCDASFLSGEVRISPSANVEITCSNRRDIIIRPKDEFARDTKYTVKVDIDDLFDGVEASDKSFTFSVTTLPLRAHARFEAMDVDASGESYDFSINLVTADREEASVAEKLISFSEGTPAWEHDTSGKTHKAILKGVKAGEKSRDITYIVKECTEGNEEGSLRVPGISEFDIYQVQVDESTKSVTVIFTKPLDEDQDATGLIYLGQRSDDNVHISGNKAKIFYPEGMTGTQTLNVNEGVQAANGIKYQTHYQTEINISGAKPNVEFLSSGSILPLGDNIAIPFRATYLRGVVVRIIKVPESNMSQYMQAGNLGGENELKRVGEYVSRQVIFLDDDPTVDLSVSHVYSLNLSELFRPEPGALYHIELSASKELSAYDCPDLKRMSHDEILSWNKIRFEEERISNGGTGYYYSFGGSSWWNYEEYDDPCSDSYYMYKSSSVNVVATNIGLMAKAGSDGTLNVWAHNIISAEAIGNARISVYNFQHRLIGNNSTDGNGLATISLGNEVPFLVVAEKGGEMAYLRVDEGNALSMSDFKISGERVQKGLKGFLYGDRGVWRPGDTIRLAFMLGDRAGTLPKSHPVVLDVRTPLGHTYMRETQTEGKLGLYCFNIPVDLDAPTGAWYATVSVGGISFGKTLRVETIKPNRLKIEIKQNSRVARPGEPLAGGLHAEWLNGAVARNLKYDIEAEFTQKSTSFAKYKDYVFDDPCKHYSASDVRVASGTTDANGNANPSFRTTATTQAAGMLNAKLTTKVYEPSGEFSIDVTTIPYSPYNTYVGIKSPAKPGEALATDATHTYKIVTVDADGNAKANQKVKLALYRVSWWWWWQSDNSYLADYTSSSYNTPVWSGTITTDAKGEGSLDVTRQRDDWGTYLIYARDLNGGHSSTVMSMFDWPECAHSINGGNSASMLNFNTDKDTYTVGENARLTIPSSEGATAILSIENGSRTIYSESFRCRAGSTDLSFQVTADMRPNVYVSVTLIQQYATTQNDHPIRMYGVYPITVDDPDSHLEPIIGTNEEYMPNTTQTIKVSERNGKEMAYTVAVVDEGLLDLTHFKTPQPWNAFNAHEALGVNTWDLYNYIIGAYGGRIEQMFSIGGDDEAASGPKALVNRFKPVVWYSGPKVLGKGSTDKIEFKVPNYNGRLRVMVIAGNGEAYGSTDKSVMVRQPVMVLGTLPRVIGINEEMSVPATVFATKSGIGSVDVSISCSDNLSVSGPAQSTLSFSDIEDKQARFTLKSGRETGVAKVTLTANGGGCKSTYECELEIRATATPSTRTRTIAIAAGKSETIKPEAFGIAGSNSLSIEINGEDTPHMASRISGLISYPHGCAEQIVSKAFAQLYLNKLASLSDKQRTDADAAVRTTLDKLKSYQTADGSIAYWPGNQNGDAWASIYAAHFMIEAEKLGYTVPGGLRNSLFSQLKKVASNWTYTPQAGEYGLAVQAYRLYVLALSGNKELGAMNRLKEVTTGNTLTRYMLAGAYAAASKREVAESILSSTIESTQAYTGYNPSYGGVTRDNAIKLGVLTVMGKTTEAASMYKTICGELSSEKWIGTQDIAMAVSAVANYLSKYGAADDISAKVDYSGKNKFSEKVKTKNTWNASLDEDASKFGEITVKNTGKGMIEVTVLTSGTPDEGIESAYSNGIVLDVNYSDGAKNVDVRDLKQGDNIIATLTVRNTSSQAIGNIAITQIVPAGWEILNTRFNDDSASQQLASGLSYQDIRDDRVLSYIDNLPAGQQVTISVKLCASYAGKFHLPAIRCEAMYDDAIKANSAAGECIVR